MILLLIDISPSIKYSMGICKNSQSQQTEKQMPIIRLKTHSSPEDYLSISTELDNYSRQSTKHELKFTSQSVDRYTFSLFITHRLLKTD